MLVSELGEKCIFLIALRFVTVKVRSVFIVAGVIFLVVILMIMVMQSVLNFRLDAIMRHGDLVMVAMSVLHVMFATMPVRVIMIAGTSAQKVPGVSGTVKTMRHMSAQGL